MHEGDELVDAGVAEALGVVAHDLEGAPGCRLIGGQGVDVAGVGQALVFGGAAGVATGGAVDEVGVLGGELVGAGDQRGGLNAFAPHQAQAGVHDVALVEDFGFAVGEEAGAVALDFVDGVDAGQIHAQAFGRGDQGGVAEQARAVGAGQGGEGFRPGDAIGHQAHFELVGAHGFLGLVAEVAVRYQFGAGGVECPLQLLDGLAFGAVAEGEGLGHRVSTFLL